MQTKLASSLCSARDRLRSRGLCADPGASFSLRVPGTQHYLFLLADLDLPRLRTDASDSHGRIYRLRPDVGGIATGIGPYSSLLCEFGGTLPLLFDEQARHLGRMRKAVCASDDFGAACELADALRDGTNSVIVNGVPLCMGSTSQRLILNTELFEKCAKGFVLAAATGKPIRQLPWWVRRIAIGRLMKDERSAACSFAQGRLPENSVGY